MLIIISTEGPHKDSKTNLCVCVCQKVKFPSQFPSASLSPDLTGKETNHQSMTANNDPPLSKHTTHTSPPSTSSNPKSAASNNGYTHTLHWLVQKGNLIYLPVRLKRDMSICPAGECVEWAYVCVLLHLLSALDMMLTGQLWRIRLGGLLLCWDALGKHKDTVHSAVSSFFSMTGCTGQK